MQQLTATPAFQQGQHIHIESGQGMSLYLRQRQMDIQCIQTALAEQRLKQDFKGEDLMWAGICRPT